MKEPLVSVIIAAYNGEKYIENCFASLFKQEYSNFEIIICDDCSQDKTATIMKKLETYNKNVKCIYNSLNLYAGATRNHCLKHSKGKYIMIQDIDDFSLPNRMKKLVQFLECNRNVDFVSTSMEAFFDIPEKSTKIIDMKCKKPTKYNFLWNLPFNHPATMFRRECLIRIGGYREDKYLRRAEDYDLFFRLYEHGYCGENLQVPLYLYRLNYKRRTFKARLQEIRVRYEGYKRLGLMTIGIPFLFKPLLAYCIQKIKTSILGYEV